MIGIKEISAMTSSYKVLYVEDDETLAATVVQYFSKIFKEVVYANNGRKGLELYKENKKFDIVFTDVEMPIMSGLEMSEEIKKINPEQNIIIISSYSDADMFVASATLGIDGYIIKPINHKELNTMLYKMVKKIKSQEQNDFDTKEIIELNDKILEQQNLIIQLQKDITEKK